MPEKSDLPQYEKADRPRKKEEKKQEEVAAPIVRKETKTSSGRIYTIQDVAANCTDKSAWTTVNGRVYDLTGFLNRHPGGYQAISRAVGKEGTEVFSK